MRCARCDRLAVPQAVGRTTDGLVVFGWCLSCLDETGCQDVMVARRDRLAKSSRRPRLSRPATSRPVDLHPRPDPMEERRKFVAAVSVVLALWGVFLVLGGLILRARTDPS